REGSVLADRRTIRRDDLLHGADRDPAVHALGYAVGEQTRSVEPPFAWFGWRTNHPRSVGLVSPLHWRREMPGRRHVVADGNRRHSDHAAARPDDDEARFRDQAVPWREGGE